MIVRMIRCDFCGKTEEFKKPMKFQNANSNASPFETQLWFSVKQLSIDDSFDIGIDGECLCRECYERMKNHKRMSSVFSETGGAK